MTRLLAYLLLPFILAACGSDSNDTNTQDAQNTSRLGDEYTATLLMTSVTNGVADITVTISANDGRSLEGEAVILSPLMKMVSTMEHGTPFSNNSTTLDENNRITSTAYFLMPSTMANGTAMGDWFINVTFDGQQTAMPITVNMMSSDFNTLKGGADDHIMGMGDSTQARTYYLYNRARHVSANMNSFEIYVAAKESMMHYPAVMTEHILNQGTLHELTINTVEVEMCSNQCEQQTNWLPAQANSNKPGVYKAMNLNLTGNDTDTVMVKLTVNDETKSNGDITHVVFSFNGDASDAMLHDDNHTHM